MGSPDVGGLHVPLPKLHSGGRLQVLNTLCGLVPDQMWWTHTSFEHITTCSIHMGRACWCVGCKCWWGVPWGKAQSMETSSVGIKYPLWTSSVVSCLLHCVGVCPILWRDGDRLGWICEKDAFRGFMSWRVEGPCLFLVV